MEAVVASDGPVPTRALLERIFNAAPAAMVCVDSAGTVRFANAQVRRLLGYTPAELIGQTVEVLVPLAVRGSHRALRGQYLSLANPGHLGLGDRNLSVLRRDGSLLSANVVLSRVDVDGSMIVTAYIRDATDRVAAESALHKSEELFRQLTASIDVSIVIRNLAPPSFAYVSPGYEKVFGYTPMTHGETPADTLRHVVAEDRAVVAAEYAGTQLEGTRIEYRIVRPGGEIRWIRSLTTPMFDPDNVVRRCAAVAADITDLKRAELTLRKADEEKQANTARSEFLSRVSHELRTPLNAVLGFAQLLELEDLTEDQHKSVEYILHGGRHLVSLVDDVLDIAKIEDHQLDMSLEAVLLAELLTEALARMATAADSAGVQLSYEPEVAAGLYVHGDSRRLRQVVDNLLSNAIKYNRPGGSVEVRCEQTAESMMDIIVSDTGLGIPADELPRLFSPFNRHGAQTVAIEGSGVGLALSLRLMTTMGGHLRAASEVGVGSTFIASIPLSAPMSTPTTFPMPVRMPAPGHRSMEPEAPPLSLLYIEDNRSNISLMQQLIVYRPQWHLITAGDGASGLALVATNVPDLVLLDLHLPDMDGIEVLRRLHADASTDKQRVVILSADASDNQIKRLLAAGAYAYLTKPLDIPKVLEVLDAIGDL